MDSQAANLGALAAPSAPGHRHALVLLLAVAALHVPTLFNPFLIDDYVYLYTVHDLDWTGIANVFTTSTMGAEASGVWWTPSGALPFYRPIGEMTFAADFLIWRLQPFGYHLMNLVLHLVCTFLAWRLARRLLDAPVAALAVAVVFALHPVHNEAVAWISGRFDLLVCLCVLASVLSYLNWQHNAPRSGLWGLLSVLWFAVGLLCKETAIVLPAVLVVVEALRWRGAGAAYRGGRLVAAALAFGSTALLYLAGRFALFGGLGNLPPPYGLDLSSPLIAIRSLTWNLAQYLLDFVLFIQVDSIYIVEFWSNHLMLMVLALAAALAICAACTMLAWRSRAFRVGLVWTVLFTVPSLMAMPGERNVYLSSVGVALIAGAAFGALLRRSDTRPAVGQWVRWVSFTTVSLWIVLGIGEHALMWGVSRSGDKVFRDLEALMPDPPRDARIYVVNQCPLNAVGFDQALRLRYGREDLSACALSLSPTLGASSVDRITRTGPDSIRLVRENGVFFASFIERFHLFSQPASSLAKACRRMGLELIDPPSSYHDMTDLEFRLPHPVDDPRVQIFIWNNRRIRSRADLVNLMNLAELRRYEPLSFLKMPSGRKRTRGN